MAADSHSTLALPAATAAAPPIADPSVPPLVMSLFDECSPRLFRYLRSVGLEPAVAEDIVQETFLSLYRHLRMGRPRDNLRAWLFQVAHNLARRHYRQSRRRRDAHALDEVTATDLRDPASNPEEQVMEADGRRAVQAALRTLSARDRQCLSLRAEGLRYRDIARVLGMSLGGVAKSVARAIAHLSKGRT